MQRYLLRRFVPEEEGALPEAGRLALCVSAFAASDFVAWRAADLADRRDRSRGVIRYFLFPVVAAATAGGAAAAGALGAEGPCLGFERKNAEGLASFDALGDVLLPPLAAMETRFGLSGLERSWLTCDFFEGLAASLVALTATTFPPADTPVLGSTTTLATGTPLLLLLLLLPLLASLDEALPPDAFFAASSAATFALYAACSSLLKKRPPGPRLRLHA